jgi:hypothetical protein
MDAMAYTAFPLPEATPEDFRAAPTGSAFSASIFEPQDIHDLAAAALSGDAEVSAIFTVIVQWLGKVAELPPGERAVCLDCDHEFTGAGDPELVCVIMPFGKLAAALYSGLCELCAEREDPMQLLLRHARKRWPDARVLDGGHG